MSAKARAASRLAALGSSPEICPAGILCGTDSVKARDLNSDKFLSHKFLHYDMRVIGL